MNEIVALEYQLNNGLTIMKEFYTNSTDAHEAEKALKLRYGNDLKWSKIVTGYDTDREYEKKHGIKNQQRQIEEQEKRLQKLEAKTSNIAYQQQAENLKSEVENISPNIQEWEEYKSALEDEINVIILEIRKKVDEYSENSSTLQESINTINTKIDKHNQQPNIYDSNKIDLLKSLDDTLNTEVDFNKKIDEDLGIGGWVFIILILALILYAVDWFFELNIYSSAYTFIKSLFENKT